MIENNSLDYDLFKDASEGISDAPASPEDIDNRHLAEAKWLRNDFLKSRKLLFEALNKLYIGTLTVDEKVTAVNILKDINEYREEITIPPTSEELIKMRALRGKIKEFEKLIS